MHSKVSLPNVIDGVSGSVSIVNMWRSHYNYLFNCINNDTNVHHDLYNNVCYEPDIEVSHDDITSGIEGLANNKSCGLDGVSAEHLKHSSNRIVPMLAMCFTGLFIHGMLPPSIISVVLVPIVKRQSHRHDARPAHWKSSNFGQCVVVRWVCVTMRHSCVERAGPTLCTRRCSFCASGILCMHKNVRGARRMNVLARRTPEMRRARWTNARDTRGTRGAHAEHTLGMRCVFVD